MLFLKLKITSGKYFGLDFELKQDHQLDKVTVDLIIGTEGDFAG